jgi:transcription termination/antitermination protein NusG
METQATQIFTVRCTANREEQVLDFLSSNVAKKKLQIYSAFHPHGMRGYIFIEAPDLAEAQRAVYQIPYARGVLEKPVGYNEIEHMFDIAKTEVNILKGDIAEVISGPFKREKVKVTRIDKTKEEVVVELLEAAVPIPITVKMDAIKVIRREDGNEENDMGYAQSSTDSQNQN